ncbi:hypothetical protein FH972_022606 [Carpinus fangiana]|uniref:PDZ GRASP-type domain-containing protein n=1 Tax=Carpinus fangiana TaxID=176857 RepID=A0A5N6KT23_9ROSI|nr:hypothetical protein FH972_022606 [Carpinus fangiana]
MFASLNRFIARLDGDQAAQPESRLRGAYGFQVLRNTNDDLPLEPWFDFIVGDNPDPNLFIQEIRNLAGNNVNLGLWCTKGQRTKTIWASIPADGTSLGLSLQWAPLTSTEEVWHVLDVAPNSPADLAGLLPYGDYIIGSPEGLVRGENGLGELIEHFLDKPLRLHVYNHEYNVTRLLTLTPSRSWGGTGALGCVLGYGALHRIPVPLDEPPAGPGETLFESGSTNGSGRPSTDGAHLTGDAGPPQYLVPADMDLGRSSSPSAPPRGGAKKARAKHHTAAGGKGDMDAYFAEEEEKSRQLESSSSPGAKKEGLAPPPKAGAGPPRAKSPLKEEATTEVD